MGRSARSSPRSRQSDSRRDFPAPADRPVLAPDPDRPAEAGVAEQPGLERRVAAAEGESMAESQRSSSEAEVEVESAKEEVETEPEVEAETSVENEVENEAENEAEKEVETEDPFSPPRFEKETTTSGPLIGWTLTLRNKVNGQYVKRPEQLEREDNWQIEYNVQEIPEENAWKLYNATKERRRQLVGLGDEEVDAGLLNYRKLIQRYASRGRKWRAQQDLVEEGRGVRVFRPLGPGAEEHAEKAGSEDAGENKE